MYPFMASTTDRSKDQAPLADPLVLEMCDMVGNVIENWGFRKILGRIWTLLYLSPEPLSAADIKTQLGVSIGGVSMALKELERWGVVIRTLGPVSRRDYYVAETNLWRMISRVLRERERSYIENAIEYMERAREALARRGGSREAVETARFQQERVERLMDAARIGLKLLDGLLTTARLDASPLRNLRLVRDFALGKRGR
jgi:HTH-type transcriptional regulator, glycine betaine synthesis regulator